jgi:hypothetical protein
LISPERSRPRFLYRRFKPARRAGGFFLALQRQVGIVSCKTDGTIQSAARGSLPELLA